VNSLDLGAEDLKILVDLFDKLLVSTQKMITRPSVTPAAYAILDINHRIAVLIAEILSDYPTDSDFALDANRKKWLSILKGLHKRADKSSKWDCSPCATVSGLLYKISTVEVTVAAKPDQYVVFKAANVTAKIVSSCQCHSKDCQQRCEVRSVDVFGQKFASRYSRCW
jgi:hypothetical protein